jgi:hypothetical protein
MKLSILYTTGRPDKAEEVLRTWKEATVLATTEFILSTKEPISIDGVKCVSYDDKCPDNAVAGWNYAAEFATGGVLMCISDDLTPRSKGFDKQIIDWAKTSEADMKALLIWSSDRIFRKKFGLIARNIMYHPVIKREVFDEWGYIYHPGFTSMFCDNTLTWMLDGKTDEDFTIQFDHNHRIFNDDVMKKHEHPNAYRVGQELINKLNNVRFNPKAFLPEWWVAYKKEFAK